jgi:hypothetical protein
MIIERLLQLSRLAGSPRYTRHILMLYVLLALYAIYRFRKFKKEVETLAMGP